jgi:hypothetical protein
MSECATPATRNPLTSGQWWDTSGFHFVRMFSKEEGLTTEDSLAQPGASEKESYRLLTTEAEQEHVRLRIGQSAQARVLLLPSRVPQRKVD